MIHVYIQKFDVMDTVGKFLGTKHNLNLQLQGHSISSAANMFDLYMDWSMMVGENTPIVG